MPSAGLVFREIAFWILYDLCKKQNKFASYGKSCTPRTNTNSVNACHTLKVVILLIIPVSVPLAV